MLLQITHAIVNLDKKHGPLKSKAKTPDDFSLATVSALDSNLNANLTNHQA